MNDIPEADRRPALSEESRRQVIVDVLATAVVDLLLADAEATEIGG